LLAAATVVSTVAIVCSPWLTNLWTLGFHDWDVETSHRYLVKLSLLRYGELPGWNPYACGGFPAWGFIEGGTILVSPWLVPYLVLPMALSLRVEVIGMGLLGVAGAYAVAGRFSRSPAARALVVALWGLDSRWALQASVGHTWHLSYALLPWCLYFFERARMETSRFGPRFGLAAMLAMLVYSGGIYPLSHTVLSLGLYAVALAALERSGKPLGVLAASGVLGVGLSAPKLLPMLHVFGRAPRLVASDETLDVRTLIELLTSTDQGVRSIHGHLQLGWHEYGMYVSFAGIGLLALGLLVARGRRELALGLVGLAFIVLALGSFHPAAPWRLLHRYIPFFASQHVPSRFLYPALLLLSLVAASGLGRWAQRRRFRQIAASAAVLCLGLHVAMVARQPMTQGMWMVAPPIPESPEFHFSQEPPFAYEKPDWAGPVYLAMLGNRGVVNCYGAPPFEGQRARAISDPHYRGEVYVDGPDGQAGVATARVAAWGPNLARVELEGAGAGSTLVYNMNYDDGWRSDAGPVVAVDNKVAVRLDGPRSSVTFRYLPPRLPEGLLLAGLSVAACAVLFRRARMGRLTDGASRHG
jgi:hypothetical protein